MICLAALLDEAVREVVALHDNLDEAMDALATITGVNVGERTKIKDALQSKHDPHHLAHVRDFIASGMIIDNEQHQRKISTLGGPLLMRSRRKGRACPEEGGASPPGGGEGVGHCRPYTVAAPYLAIVADACRLYSIPPCCISRLFHAKAFH